LSWILSHFGMHKRNSCNQTHSIVNVTAILADPFSLPVLGVFFGLLGLRLFVSKYVQTGCRSSGGYHRWSNHKSMGCRCTEAHAYDHDKDGEDGGFHFDDGYSGFFSYLTCNAKILCGELGEIAQVIATFLFRSIY
jgi:hypothetical protein